VAVSRHVVGRQAILRRHRQERADDADDAVPER
jgi:hypothetical protein